MGYSNPPIPWSEFERRLSDSRRPGGPPVDGRRRRQPRLVAQAAPLPAEGAAARGRRGRSCRTRSCTRTRTSASSTAPRAPRSCSRRRPGSASRALALTDHDGFYGAVRLAEAAEQHDGAHRLRRRALARAGAPQNGVPTRRARTCCCSPAAQEGYHAMAGDHRRAARGRGGLGHRRRREGQAGLRPRRPRDARGGRDWLVLTGCRKGRVRQALVTGAGSSPAAAGRELDALVERFGRDNVVVELFDHGAPLDTARERRARRARRAPGGCPSSPPATSTTPPRTGSPAGDGARRGARPPQPRRDGRLAARHPTRPPALGRRDGGSGSPATPAPSRPPSRSPTRPGSAEEPEARAAEARRAGRGTRR